MAHMGVDGVDCTLEKKDVMACYLRIGAGERHRVPVEKVDFAAPARVTLWKNTAMFEFLEPTACDVVGRSLTCELESAAAVRGEQTREERRERESSRVIHERPPVPGLSQAEYDEELRAQFADEQDRLLKMRLQAGRDVPVQEFLSFAATRGKAPEPRFGIAGAEFALQKLKEMSRPPRAPEEMVQRSAVPAPGRVSEEQRRRVIAEAERQAAERRRLFD